MRRLGQGLPKISQQQQHGSLLVAAFKACGSLKHLDFGEALHKHSAAQDDGELLRSCILVATSAVDMYAKCGRMKEAREVFDSAIDYKRDTVCWNALILGYAVNGEEEEALKLFRQLKRDDHCSPNDRTFVCGLMACSRLAEKEPGIQVCGQGIKLRCLEMGMEMHSEAATAGYDSDMFVANALVGVYSKCGSLLDARAAFDRMKQPDVVSWTSLLMGNVENGESCLALELFFSMVSRGIAMNSRTFTAALMACSCLATAEAGKIVAGKLVKVESLEKGMAVHCEAVKKGWDESDMFLGSALLDMYSKCGSLVDAWEVFKRMQQRDVVSWTALIQGCAENGEAEEALKLFHTMERECVPNSRTFVAALMACASLKCLETGRRIHSQAAKSGCDDSSDIFIANTLVGMYAKCGSLADAHKVFDRMAKRDVVSWTCLILGYVEIGEAELALVLFWRMLSDQSCVPDSRSFVAALMACGSLAQKEQGSGDGDQVIVKVGSLERGVRIHALAAKHSCETDIFVASALVDMYSKCWSMIHARGVFQSTVHRDVVLWNALMIGYVENGEPEVGLELFSDMKRQGCSPDSQSFVASITACAALATKEEGKLVDGKLVKLDCLSKGMRIHAEAAAEQSDPHASNVFVCNTLVDMYAKCGSLVDAREVFDRMRYHDLVSWNSLILASYECGDGNLALELVEAMKLEGFVPDSRTLVATLLACGSLVNVETGKQIHAQICRSGLDSSTVVASNLAEFYGKCGSVLVAQLLFDSSSDTRNVFAWNSLIAGYSRQGDAARVLESFEKMQEEGMKPNSITFLSLLTTCSHCGLVKQGKEIFRTMSSANGVSPRIVHFRCVVDLLGRANHLEDALVMLSDEDSCLKEDVLAWTSFLASCGKWNDARLGKLAYETLVRLDGKNSSSAYSLMSNLYATAG